MTTIIFGSVEKQIHTDATYLGDFMDEVCREFEKCPLQLKPMYLREDDGRKIFLQPHLTMEQVARGMEQVAGGGGPIHVEFSPDVNDWDEERTAGWLSVVGGPTRLQLTGEDLLDVESERDLDKYEDLTTQERFHLWACIDRLKSTWSWTKRSPANNQELSLA